jgi:transposase
MKFSKPALLALKGLDEYSKEQLAKKMGVSLQTLKRWIKRNNDNLTMAGHLDIISKEIGLGVEQILAKEPIAA